MELKRKWSRLCQLRVHSQSQWNQPTRPCNANATTSSNSNSNPGLCLSFEEAPTFHGRSRIKHQDVMTTLSLLLDSVETSDEVHRHESEALLEARTAAAKPSDMNSVPWLSTCELPPPSGDLKRKAESVRMPSESKRWMGGGGGLDLNLRADDDIAWRERRHSCLPCQKCTCRHAPPCPGRCHRGRRGAACTGTWRNGPGSWTASSAPGSPAGAGHEPDVDVEEAGGKTVVLAWWADKRAFQRVVDSLPVGVLAFWVLLPCLALPGKNVCLVVGKGLPRLTWLTRLASAGEPVWFSCTSKPNLVSTVHETLRQDYQTQCLFCYPRPARHNSAQQGLF